MITVMLTVKGSSSISLNLVRRLNLQLEQLPRSSRFSSVINRNYYSFTHDYIPRRDFQKRLLDIVQRSNEIQFTNVTEASHVLARVASSKLNLTRFDKWLGWLERVRMLVVAASQKIGITYLQGTQHCLAK